MRLNRLFRGASIASVLTAALAFATGIAVAQSTDDAQKSGEAWLSLIDNQKYADSWKDASSYFRMRVPEQQWVAMVKGVRGPLGSMKSRTVQSATATKSLPGAPDGDYVVIIFQASYQNKASAVETLTVMKDGGQWRSAGYFIR